MLVRRPLRVAVEMKVRTSGVRVRVQVPAAPRVAQDHRPTERDQQQRDQEVSRRPEPVGKMQPEQDDAAHHHAHARGVAERPREAQAASVEQAALAGRERRYGREVVRLERVTEAQQQAEAGEGEQVGRGGTHDGSQFTLTILSCVPTIPFPRCYNLLTLCPIEGYTWSSPLPGGRHCAEIRTSRRWGARKLPRRRSPPPGTAAPSSACTGPTWRGCTARGGVVCSTAAVPDLPMSGSA